METIKLINIDDAVRFLNKKGNILLAKDIEEQKKFGNFISLDNIKKILSKGLYTELLLEVKSEVCFK